MDISLAPDSSISYGGDF